MPRLSAFRASTACLLTATLLACASGPAPPAREASPKPSLLGDVHQLSFQGRRAGEGYFSRDASRLIFQSEREAGNPFYQIYTLDLRSGQATRISPGVGKATCGWIHPGGRRALFASTHLDPEAPAKQDSEWALRESGKNRRYAWDYDPNYDLFSVPLDAPGPSVPQALTRTFGYDAEASWSPNGREILFASNRHAYAEGAQLDPAQLERDPAYFIDLYRMDSSGRNIRRLTDHPGYDGGPFFSPDGERIVWRRFSPDGATAEIYSMRGDGSDVRQLTNLGVMSWAPFYHPSGEYLIFTTNLHGHANFELYMVDTRGEHAPVRVTDAPGFDGLPVFAPDGEELVWTSNRTVSGQSQLFRATWNDAHARALLELPDKTGPQATPLLPLPLHTDAEIREEDLRAHVEALSSDITEGRLTGTAGERIATSYVARAFRAIGLEPAGDGGTYFQTFGFTAGVSLGEGNRLEIRHGEAQNAQGVAPGAPSPPQSQAQAQAQSQAQAFKVDVDWRPFAFSREGTIASASVVYAGYGIVAPAGQNQRAIDHYAGLDVQDRWVVVFRYVPRNLSPESRQHLHRYSSLRYKAMLARDRGARGLLVVSGPNSRIRNEVAPLRFDVSLAGSSIAAVSISDAVAGDLMRGSGKTLAELHDQADSASAAVGFPLEGTLVSAQIELEQQRRSGRNVIGRLQMGPEPSMDFIVVGAHVDHLGRGEGASSLALEGERGAIHPGADDNASGVAALLEMAEKLATGVADGELSGQRDLVFAAWSGEELGLLGSSAWVKDAADPHAEDGGLAQQVAAYLNFDMVGRMSEAVSLFGVGSSNAWPGEIERANIRIAVPILPQRESLLPTDATSFFNRGVPILAAFTGAHSDYHTPRDTPDKLDYASLRKIAELMSEIGLSVSALAVRPDFVPAAPGESNFGPSAIRVYLGTVPDYARGDVVGLALSGVARGGPAERGGLRAGDIIVEVAGRKIENIYDYTYALDALEIGDPVRIIALRGDRRLSLEITPISRD